MAKHKYVGALINNLVNEYLKASESNKAGLMHFSGSDGDLEGLFQLPKNINAKPHIS